MDIPTHSTLKEYQRKHREQWGTGLNLRVHRALSWLNRAEQERAAADTDCEFIFLWIAFNAAYSSQYTQEIRMSEKAAFDSFLGRIVDYDKKKSLYGIIWEHYTTDIRALMDNQFVYQPFWDRVNADAKDESWREGFTLAKRRSHQALAEQDVVTSLSILLSRLYTLRNQLLHGGATWKGSLNREQIERATGILRCVVPIVIELMMENGTDTWGDAVYFLEG
ncbi:HEPN domain-containing protein [Aliidiomarina indica]|uniref:HEPN domain-containing protein n=1 Tax=Aliidiomarina indica TaxID=2749147 RepID=UPI00188EDA0B|nr:HEPN domain-containing protein [Aliidiomarina indica]